MLGLFLAPAYFLEFMHPPRREVKLKIEFSWPIYFVMSAVA